VGLEALSMTTTVVAYRMVFVGLITTLGGLFGALILLFKEAARTGRVPFRYYATVVGLISGGLGMIGVGQGCGCSCCSLPSREEAQLYAFDLLEFNGKTYAASRSSAVSQN
jgi:hypothetical protein